MLATGGRRRQRDRGGLAAGARTTLYAVRLADLVGLRGLRGAVLGQLVIDETTVMATAQRAPAFLPGAAMLVVLGGAVATTTLVRLTG